MKYPETESIPYRDEYGENAVMDDYAWLSDAGGEKAQAWLKSQHACTDAFFSENKQYASRYQSLKHKSETRNILSLKYQHGHYVGVYDTPLEGQNAFISNEDFSDIKIMQKAQKPYTTLFSAEFSPTDPHCYLFTGYYEDETRVSINVATYPDHKVIARFGFGFAYHWSEDGQFIYYSKAVVDPLDTTRSIQEIYRYCVAEGHQELLYVFAQDAVYVDFSQSADQIIAKIVIDYHDCQLVAISEDGSVKAVTEAVPVNYEYLGTIQDELYFCADETGDQQTIVRFSLKAGWSERTCLDSIQASVMNATLVGERLIVFVKEDIEDFGYIYDKEGRELEKVKLPSDFVSVRIIDTDKDREIVYLHFESVSHPARILALDPYRNETHTVLELSHEPIAKHLAVEKHHVTVRDGTKTVLYLVKEKGSTPTKDTPLLLHGYGGYGVSQSLGYHDSVTRYSMHDWCSQGGVYVNVIVRGGGEYGKSWHEDGKLDRKRNTFNDLFDLTEYLHRHDIASPKKTALAGLSNGGLLVSAAYTMRPDLYGCIIDSVGLNDMLHFAKDPRGSMYQSEYGNPYQAEMFAYLKSYSPYHNVSSGVDYPAIYIHSGLLDTNVPPYHGMKFAAKCQKLNPEGNPVLLRVLPEGHHDLGHGEAHWLTIAERQCFIEQILKIA